MTPTELAVELDRVANKLESLSTEATSLSKKRQKSQYLHEAVENINKCAKFLDKAIDALLRGKSERPKPEIEVEEGEIE